MEHRFIRFSAESPESNSHNKIPELQKLTVVPLSELPHVPEPTIERPVTLEESERQKVISLTRSLYEMRRAKGPGPGGRWYGFEDVPLDVRAHFVTYQGIRCIQAQVFSPIASDRPISEYYLDDHSNFLPRTSSQYPSNASSVLSDFAYGLRSPTRTIKAVQDNNDTLSSAPSPLSVLQEYIISPTQTVLALQNLQRDTNLLNSLNNTRNPNYSRSAERLGLAMTAATDVLATLLKTGKAPTDRDVADLVRAMNMVSQQVTKTNSGAGAQLLVGIGEHLRNANTPFVFGERMPLHLEVR